MMEEISVLIADDNVEFGNLLNKYLEQEVDIRVVGIARDGVEAVDLITSLMPDIVILDIIMPNLDGIGVLEKLSQIQLSKRPLFIILSAIGQDIFIQKAITLGAEYYIVKPFDINVLLSRIRQIFKEEKVSPFSQYKFTLPPAEKADKKQDEFHALEIEVTNLMREIGLSPHMSGYQYLREAIILSVTNPKTFTSITRYLYPTVAEKFNSSSQKVERAIRNAIENAWSRGNQDSIDNLFGYTVNYSKGKPTNSEFIAMIADRVKISLGIK